MMRCFVDLICWKTIELINSLLYNLVVTALVVVSHNFYVVGASVRLVNTTIEVPEGNSGATPATGCVQLLSTDVLLRDVVLVLSAGDSSAS